MAAEPGQPENIATAVAEVSERMSVLVREEIELAKAEVSEKVKSLVRGAVVGIAAGIFVVTGVLFLLHGLAWFSWYEFFGANDFFWGFFVVAGALFVLGGLAGFAAARALRAGAPPVPEMAIDEARKIRETVGVAGGDGQGMP